MSEQTREVSESFQTLTNQVTTYLQPLVQAIGDITITGLQRIAVGWSHETWLFDATWVDASGPQTRGLCLRRDPGNALLRNMSDLGEQFRVLQCLEQTAVPAPKAYWFEPDHSVLGASALIMERVAGECPSPWGREGRQFYAAAAARSVLPMDFTDTLAAIHTVDWQAAGLSFLGVPETGTGFARREIAKWRNLAEQSGLPIEPVLVDLMCWLEVNAPSCERLVLVHGAYRTGNLLIQNDRISAVLDWELQVLGDPMYDVAYVLTDLNREGSDLLSHVVERDAFLQRYEAATGIEVDLDACRYYQLLYAMRSAAFWMSAAGLYADGSNNDLRLARTAWSITAALNQAAVELGY